MAINIFPLIKIFKNNLCNKIYTKNNQNEIEIFLIISNIYMKKHQNILNKYKQYYIYYLMNIPYDFNWIIIAQKWL